MRCIAWYKHERGWENYRQWYKPSTSARVCMTVSNSPNRSSVYIRLCKHRKKVYCCFYNIASSKNYNAGKDKNFILRITYLPTTLIWQWHFSTVQSKRTFQNLVMTCLQLVYLYVTQPCLRTLMQPRLSANQSARTILVIL